MTFDAMSNSPSHSQLNTRKENLVSYQKSLKAFLQVPLQLLPINFALLVKLHDFNCIENKQEQTSLNMANLLSGATATSDIHREAVLKASNRYPRIGTAGSKFSDTGQ